MADDDETKTELQIQIEATKIRTIQGQPAKIPDLDQWEKITKYVEKRNLSKVPREDLDRILFILWPYVHRIQALESMQQGEIDRLKKEMKADIARAKDEQEEALDVQEFLTRELQEKEEDITALRQEYEGHKMDVLRKHELDIQAMEEKLEEAESEKLFMQREVEYAEQKLAGMEGGENQTASMAMEELNQLRQDKLASQKEARDLRKELKDLMYEMKMNTAKTSKMQAERDEAIEQAATVKDTIKTEVDQLEEEVSRELAAKDQEIVEFVRRNEELERHGERLEQKINFLIKENAELEAREDVGQGGLTNRTPRTARGPGILQAEQLEFAREQIVGLEERNSDLKELLEAAQVDGSDKVNELKDQIAQMIVDNEDLVEKAAQSDQLREWVEQLSLEKEDDKIAADQEIGELKANFHTEKLVAIDAAIVDMKERNAEMEANIEDVDYQRMEAEESFAQAMIEVDRLKDEVEGLEVTISQLKVESRTGGGQDDSREVNALKKQLQALQVQRDTAVTDAEATIQKERIRFAEKINELETKFQDQLNQDEDEADAEKDLLREQIGILEEGKAGILNMNLALAKQLREKEIRINNVEFAVSDLHLQLKNAVQDQQAAEEEKMKIEQELEELLEIQEHNENEWKENAQIISLNQQVQELQGQVETLEEQSLEDLEQLECEKATELENALQALKERYEKIIDEKDEELESLLNDNEEELRLQSRELNSVRAIEFMRKTCNEIRDNGCARAIVNWSKKYSTASVTGMQRLLETTQARLKEYQDMKGLQLKELRKEVEDEVNDIRIKMATEQENAKAAQGQVLFMTTMVAKQLGEANCATAVALLSNMLNNHDKQASVLCFYHWKETTGPSTGPQPRNREMLLQPSETESNHTECSQCSRKFTKAGQEFCKFCGTPNLGRSMDQSSRSISPGYRSDRVLSPAPKSTVRNILKNAEYQQRNAAEMEYLIVNELHATMIATAQGRLQLNECNRLRKSNQARLSSMDSVHELELQTKRNKEKEWTIQKEYLEQELEMLRRKTDIEMGLFNQIQGSMHAEKRELQEKLHATESELGQVQTALAAEKNRGFESMHITREEQVNVSFKTGFWKLCWVFSSRNKTIITGMLRIWNSHTIDAKCAVIATTKQENTSLNKLLLDQSHQYALTTSALRESLSRLSKERAIDKASMILKRNTSRLLGSTLATWYANKVRYDTTHNASTQAHAILEANQKQMGMRNHELWISLQDNKEKQIQIGMKTLHSIFSRFHKLAYNGIINIWRNTVFMEKNIWKETYSLKVLAGIQKLASLFSSLSMMAIQKVFMTLKKQFDDYTTAKLAAMRIGLNRFSIVLQTATLIQMNQAVSNWQVSFSTFKAVQIKLSSDCEIAEVKAAAEMELEQRLEQIEEEAAERAREVKEGAEKEAKRTADKAAEWARQAKQNATEHSEQFQVIEESAHATFAVSQAAQICELDAAEESEDETKQLRMKDQAEIKHAAGAKVADEDLAESKVHTEADGDLKYEDRPKDETLAGLVDCGDVVTVAAAISTSAGTSPMLGGQDLEDLHSTQGPLTSKSPEVLVLFDCLDQAECALREQIIDGQELEAEYQRLEIVFHSKTLRKDLDLEPRPLITLDDTTKRQNEIMNNVAAQHDLHEVPEILAALDDIENALMEQATDNKYLEYEIERLEVELSL